MKSTWEEKARQSQAMERERLRLQRKVSEGGNLVRSINRMLYCPPGVSVGCPFKPRMAYWDPGTAVSACRRSLRREILGVLA